ncbi:hypothetical protein [uncultured Croceitalea sp.]|uniref:OB-fold protein n=1 Tax=uncultured Croceitalea sp. TaxID=1798908 RepID=UPI003306683B
MMFSLSILLLIVSIYSCYTILNERPFSEDIISSSSEIAISSEGLLQDFLEDEQEANATYVEKIIEVEGKVKEVTFLNDRYTVLLHSGTNMAYVMCDMRTEQAALVKELKEGDVVRLKGIFKGFLMDAIMLNCVLL